MADELMLWCINHMFIIRHCEWFNARDVNNVSHWTVVLAVELCGACVCCSSDIGLYRPLLVAARCQVLVLLYGAIMLSVSAEGSACRSGFSFPRTAGLEVRTPCGYRRPFWL
mmetsp:Transcript_97521/g.254288  ORF Transcript_97521/g.254288 Transcript_97521/m.254288 type:complete len:112 (-) Transcript_97521:520-855(-)